MNPYKRAVLYYLCAVLSILLAGCSEKALSNIPQEDNIASISDSNIADLDAWVGAYTFYEHWYPYKNMQYELEIFREENHYYANLSIDGVQTMTRLKAVVEGDSTSIDIVFDSYLPENLYGAYKQGDTLLTFREEQDRIVTDWGELQPILKDNGEPGRVYFVKDRDGITIDDIENPKMIEEARFYAIFEGDNYEYYYYIYDGDKTIVDEGRCWRYPTLSMLTDSIVRLRIQAGTGISTSSTRYYDVEKNKISPWYSSVYSETDALLVLSEYKSLIVQDLFDEGIYYRAFAKFQHELAANTVEPFVRVQFIGDGRQIIVTYLTGDDFTEVTETIPLDNETTPPEDYPVIVGISRRLSW